ncbi:MAG: Crp/Fnr family transcriptional regulator [Ruminococcus sp.]|nr:Crp/Fnr family transcriptional regulator [Ruminococcus sp.]
MRKYQNVLRQCRLFEHVSDENLLAMLGCLHASIQRFHKNQMILTEGMPASHIGIVLSGTVQLVRVDYYGNRSIVASMTASQLFGESFVCAEVQAIPVSIVAAEDCEVMLVDGRRIVHACSNACEFHSRMIFNLLKIVAAKNLLFNQKIEITSRRTTREKLMTYLLQQAKVQGSSFVIPYNRQELADFLEVDRSGLSAEISKLRREGVLTCRKNAFTLLREDAEV